MPYDEPGEKSTYIEISDNLASVGYDVLISIGELEENQIGSNYFLTQRVKSSQKDYAERLAKHHAVIVAAMKAKQNADKKYAQELQKSIQALAPYYPEH